MSDSHPPPHRRRWLRVSVRSLMILVLVLGGVAGWVANTVRTQREAIALIKAAGGQITFDYQRREVVTLGGGAVKQREPAAPAWVRRWLGDELFQNVQAVNLLKPVSSGALAALARFDRLESLLVVASPDLADGLARLRGLTRLERLSVVGPGVTDDILAELSRLDSLRWLAVGQTVRPARLALPANQSPATDTGFAHLAGLRHLADLSLTNFPNLTDAGLAQLVERLPRLRSFTAPGRESVAATLAALGRHQPDLRSLSLNGCGMSDGDLAALAGMKRLDLLRLERTGITDAGLVHLESLASLFSLYIGNPGVTDEGLRRLNGLTHLESLNLVESRVTGVGLSLLVGMPLNELWLSSTLITDPEMATVAQLTHLRRLILSYNPGLTDAALLPLRTLPDLRVLNVTATAITPEGIAALRQAVPTLSQVTTQFRVPAQPSTAK